MRTFVSGAVLIAFCAITSLVADDGAVVEHEVRAFLSDVGRSFESRDVEAIKTMVSDKELQGRLLEQMRYDRRPLYFRLEFDSILMPSPFIVRARLFRQKDMYPHKPILVDVLLEKLGGRIFIAGYWSSQMVEIEFSLGKAADLSRQMVGCINSGDENAVLRLFGAEPGAIKGNGLRKFLMEKGVEWIDDAIRSKGHIQGEMGIPVPIDVTDSGSGVQVFFSVLDARGAVAGTYSLLFKGEHFVGKFVSTGNEPRATTSFEFENRAALEDGVRKYMSDLTGAVESGDSAAVRKMVKNEKVLRSWLGEIEKGKAPGFKLEYDSLVSLSPLVARAKMRSGEGQGAGGQLLVEMQLERTEGRYEMVKIAARQSDEEMFKAHGATNAAANVVSRTTCPFAPEMKVTLENDVRNYVSLFGSAMKARDVTTVKKIVKDEKSTQNILKEMAKIKLQIHKLEFDSILSLTPLIVRVRFFESVKSKKPDPVEMQLERMDGGYAIVKIWSDQLEKQNLAVRRASLESRKMVLYVNRCDTNSVVQLFGAKVGNGGDFKFREFLKRRGVEWIDNVMRENRRIEGGWAKVLRHKGEVVGMCAGFNELNPDKSVKCWHELLYKDGHFVGKRTPKPVVDSK